MGRASYVYKACLRCRKQKTKCTGRDPCEQCRRKNVDCIYPSGPARRRVARPSNHFHGSVNCPAATEHPHTSPTPEQLNTLQLRLTPDTSSLPPNARPTADDIDGTWPISPCSNGHNSSLLSPKSDVRRYTDTPMVQALLATRGDVIASNKQGWLGHIVAPDINRWDIQSKLIEMQYMRRTVEIYLAKVNPFVPCFNITQTRLDVEAMLAGELPGQEKRQVVAAVDLMTAIMKAMTEDAACLTRPGWTPGWTEYDRAEHLLRDSCHSNCETLRTLQCFVLKALYLTYIDRLHLAYDTMGTVARLCYQLELHNERRWRHHSTFEVHLRQRILWTAFMLDRHVSQNWNAPYMLRESDLDVALPRHIDDKKLQPDSPLLPEEESHAPIANLETCTKYARLYSEIWDRVLAVHASRSPDPGVMVAIERRVQDLRRGLPQELQWNGHDLPGVSAEHCSHFHVRQSMLLHLQINNLHLLLQRGYIDHDDIEDAAVDTYTETAINSIQTIWEYDQANLHDPIERFASTRYLMSSMKTLTRMTLHRYKVWDTMHPKAMEALSRGVSVLERFAPHLTLANIALDKLKTPIQQIMGLERIPTKRYPAEEPPSDYIDPSEGYAMHDVCGYPTVESLVGDEEWLHNVCDMRTTNSAFDYDGWFDEVQNTAPEGTLL